MNLSACRRCVTTRLYCDFIYSTILGVLYPTPTNHTILLYPTIILLYNTILLSYYLGVYPNPTTLYSGFLQIE